MAREVREENSFPSFWRNIMKKNVLKEITDNKLLPELHLRAYNGFYNHGPLTVRELSLMVLSCGDRDAIYKSTILIRDLEESGAIKKVGKKFSPITQNRHVIWAVTNKIPVFI